MYRRELVYRTNIVVYERKGEDGGALVPESVSDFFEMEDEEDVLENSQEEDEAARKDEEKTPAKRDAGDDRGSSS